MSQEAEALGKLSVEIVGKEHDMNYKKVHALCPAQPPCAGASGKGRRKKYGLYARRGAVVYQAGKPAADRRVH